MTWPPIWVWSHILNSTQRAGLPEGMARQQCGCGLNDHTPHRGRICKIIMYYSILLHMYTHIRECTIDVESLSSSPIIISTITSHIILLYTIKIILE